MARRLFDAHFHVVDPAHPLVENNGFLPDPFTVADYRARVRDLNVCGGAMRAVLGVNPGALMAGTDVPSTRAKHPFADDDLALIERVALEVGGEQAADDVFWNNAAGWYLR